MFRSPAGWPLSATRNRGEDHQMARVNDIRFVGYGGSDIEAERRFYLDAWKLVEVPSDDGLVYLAAPGSDTEYCVRLRQTDERLEQPRRRPSGVALLGVPLQQEVRVEQPAGGAQPVGVARVGRRERAVEAVRLLPPLEVRPQLGQRQQ